MKFLAYYEDEIKKELLNFKKNDNIAIDRWLNVIERQNLDCLKNINFIVRALGSRESTVSFSPLDRVGNLLANKLNAQYVPKILSKKITQPLKFKGRYENRIQALRGAYNCVRDFPVDEYASFLIIDDVITTKATGDEIARVLRETYGDKIKIFRFALVYTPLRNEYEYGKQQFNHQFYKKLMVA